jgi:hypothetical protein
MSEGWMPEWMSEWMLEGMPEGMLEGGTAKGLYAHRRTAQNRTGTVSKADSSDEFGRY